MIMFTYTITNPKTMMIISLYANLAFIAMSGSILTIFFAM